MFLKILVTLVLCVVAWTVATRLTGPRLPRRRKPRDLAKRQNTPGVMKCAGCGIYLPPGERCHCNGDGNA